MSSLKIDVSGNKVTLSGYLDENSDLKPMAGLSGPVEIDFSGVSRVNSCGVRDWVNMITTLSGAQLTYTNCPIVVVKQLNAVPDFMGTAVIKNFQAPYYCESCDDERNVYLETAQISGTDAPTAKCESCGEAMNFDAIPGQYFSFLARKQAA